MKEQTAASGINSSSAINPGTAPHESIMRLILKQCERCIPHRFVFFKTLSKHLFFGEENHNIVLNPLVIYFFLKTTSVAYMKMKFILLVLISVQKRPDILFEKFTGITLHEEKHI